QGIVAGACRHIEYQLVALGSHLGHQTLQTCSLCMHCTGRIRTRVGPKKFLYLRFFICRHATLCLDHRGSTLASFRALSPTIKPGVTAGNTRLTTHLNAPTRACSTPETPRKPRADRRAQPETV